MKELFPQSEISQKSPRLLWMEENDFHTNFRGELDPAFPLRWEAYIGDYETAVANAVECGEMIEDGIDKGPLFSTARTEKEALRNLCDNRGIDYLT